MDQSARRIIMSVIGVVICGISVGTKDIPQNILTVANP